jgi:aspartate beta-hydroxylase
MSQPATAVHEIGALESQAMRALQAGREDEATRLWSRILEIDPRHPRTLSALGQRAFRRGDLQGARTFFERLVAADGRDPQQWVHLALVCRALKDEAGEEAAIQKALAADPMDLLALYLRGNLLERQGLRHRAAQAYAGVAAVAPPMERLHPDLRAAVSQAVAFRDQYDRELAQFLEERLADPLRDRAGDDLRRFRDALDIMVGRKRRFDSQPVLFYYPRLPAIEFFDRAQFPWMDELEAATDAIRDEFIQILRTEEGFTPYITYPPDVPHNQWAELNNSPRWSAFHLYKMGERIEANAVRCPHTMAVIERVPQPVMAGRTPAAMFSLLQPKTRIPPHTGVTNVRLVTHLPLIVPEGCRFRVGNEMRPWVPGKAWVFDDTIEHEAWNDSEKLRVVLIFDVWHPLLSDAERAMVSALADAWTAFIGGVEETQI